MSRASQTKNDPRHPQPKYVIRLIDQLGQTLHWSERRLNWADPGEGTPFCGDKGYREATRIIAKRKLYEVDDDYSVRDDGYEKRIRIVRLVRRKP